MHSALNRLQNVFGFFTTIAFFVASLAALSVFLHPGAPSAEVKLGNVQVVRGRPHYYSTKKEEYAHIKFDLDADLCLRRTRADDLTDFSSLFNWNTKQLFVYVLASYPSTSTSSSSVSSLSESIIWDIIIPAPETSFSVSALREKYFSKTPKNVLSKKSKAKSKPKSTVAKPGILKLKNQKPKYQISDVSGKIAELQNVTLVVGYNVQPHVGVLQWDGWSVGRWMGEKEGRSEAFVFPELKGAKKTTTGEGLEGTATPTGA